MSHDSSPLCDSFPSVLALAGKLSAWAFAFAIIGTTNLHAVDYEQDIKKLFRDRCITCHGSLKQAGDLRLDAGSLVHQGGTKTIVHKGKSDESELIHRVTSKDEEFRMPPEGRPLSETEIQLLRQWIDDGASYPENELIPQAPSKHWAFQSLNRPQVPNVENTFWPNNPIDCFVLAKWESQGQKAPTPARPAQLLRRAYLDLIGIPPTLEEQQTFVEHADFDQVIDELLARPTYGERWARHWLDVVRYADSNGYERDAEKPFVWRYRDYVIDAFNFDKPFDQFVVEQIAGDELDNQELQSTIATGFLRLGNWDDEPADPATDRYDQLDDIVSTVGQAFLGLTIGCARCHDHKFEPLSSIDYYSLVAIFNPLDRPRSGRTELTVKIDNTDVYCWQEKPQNLPETHVLLRGSPSNLGQKVGPAFPNVLVAHQPTFPAPRGGSSGRRLGLANWITSDANPLTARVIVNRIWQQHFGVGLVRTANDFGIMGAPPSHPELLDWLADWFVHDADWSIKKLHRLILTSSSWQSQRTSSAMIHYRRLEVEAIRDSTLAVSGRLNLKKYGPAMKPPIPRAALEANTDKDKVWNASNDEEASRRSIYAFVKRGLVIPMFESLDLADTVSSCPQRQVTTVAPQALSLFNSDFAWQQAQAFASRLRQEAGPLPANQVQLAWKLALCREPNSEELQTMTAFLESEPLEQLCRVVLNLNEFVYPE